MDIVKTGRIKKKNDLTTDKEPVNVNQLNGELREKRKKTGINIDIAKEELAVIENFKFPAYNEIPDVGLYLEQTGKYINEFLNPLLKTDLTGSMISNYVKQKLLESPEKKQYYRRHIVDLIFIAIAKPILSLESVRKMLDGEKETFENRQMYESFCEIFVDTLKKTFKLKEEKPKKEEKDATTVMHCISAAVSYKIFLDRCFE